MSFTSSETIESFSSHCGAGRARRGAGQGKGKGKGKGTGGGGAGRLKGRGEKEKRSATQPGPGAQPLGGSYRGGGLSKGGCSVFVCVRGGGQEERQRRGESYPGTPGAICHIGMALELPGGPPHSRRVFRSRSGEQGGAWSSREGSEVMAYSSPGGASVSRAGGRVEGEEGGQEGGGRKARRLPGLRFPWHACKTCRRD